MLEICNSWWHENRVRVKRKWTCVNIVMVVLNWSLSVHFVFIYLCPPMNYKQSRKPTAVRSPPVHMAFASTAQPGPWLESSRYSCLFERLLALFDKLPWELQPSWVSLSGRRSGKEGWEFCSSLVVLIKYSPTSPGTTVCYSRNYSVLLWRGEVGPDDGHRVRTESLCGGGLVRSAAWGRSFQIPPFLWRTVQFSQLDLRPGWRKWSFVPCQI